MPSHQGTQPRDVCFAMQEVTYEIVERLIWCMAPEELPNALHLACNNRWGSEIALRLLQEDASRLHLLQPEPAMHPRGEQPDQQQSEQQQQQQHTQLVSELLKTCVLRRHQAVMPKLVSLPAAQCIGRLNLLDLFSSITSCVHTKVLPQL